MASIKGKSKEGRGSKTRDALIDAARSEFNSRGYFGTDTNAIAREAGFAPQTFYRHFDDKLAIFLAVYEGWVEQEWQALAPIMENRDGMTPAHRASQAAEVLLNHHRRWHGFRRSLRWLTTDDVRVRELRKKCRQDQVQQLGEYLRFPDASAGPPLALILSIEALCDAYADEVTKDHGIKKGEWAELIANRLEPFIKA